MEDFSEALYYEVVEDLVFMAKMFHLAKDKKQEHKD